MLPKYHGENVIQNTDAPLKLTPKSSLYKPISQNALVQPKGCDCSRNMLKNESNIKRFVPGMFLLLCQTIIPTLHAYGDTSMLTDINSMSSIT